MNIVLATLAAAFLFVSAIFPSSTLAAAPADPAGAMLALGRKMFFDRGLSLNADVSCASCHQAEHAYSDSREVSIGTGRRTGTRNVPSLANAAAPFFWDGRAARLEDVVLQPITNPVEMGLAGEGALLRRLRADAGYRDAFAAAFPGSGGTPSAQAAQAALAAYVRSLPAGSNALDRYMESGDAGGMTPESRRGLVLFQGAANCSACHRIDGRRPTLTDGLFHSSLLNPKLAPALPGRAVALGAEPSGGVGLGGLIESDPVVSELGRFVVTRNPKDIGAFRTPSLRDVALTAPYMHDGSIKTLREAVDREIYYRSFQDNQANSLTEQNRRDLVAFLQALTTSRRK